MKPDVYICGCSFSTGAYCTDTHVEYNTPYPELFCIDKTLSFENIAFNGSSNYGIAKQVEYAIKQQPKLILVNVTTSLRFDWTIPESRLEDLPTLANFVFNNKLNTLEPDTEKCVHSSSLITLVNGNKNRILTEYVATFVDPWLKSDMDRLIILGMIHQLKVSKIPYQIVNFNSDYTFSAPYVLEYPYSVFTKNFPVATDPNHFNSAGHLALSKVLLSTIPKTIDVNSV